jgi:predicted metalloendopeptidase
LIIIKCFQIDQGSLGLGSERYYLNPKKFESQLNAYRKYILDIIGILSSDAKVSISKEEKLKSVNEIVDFETKLAKVYFESISIMIQFDFQITVPEEDRRNHTRTYNKKKIVDLHALASIVCKYQT